MNQTFLYYIAGSLDQIKDTYLFSIIALGIVIIVCFFIEQNSSYTYHERERARTVLMWTSIAITILNVANALTPTTAEALQLLKMP